MNDDSDRVPQDDISDAPAEHNGRQLQLYERAIVSAKSRFLSSRGKLDYDEECIFAMQQLTKVSGGKQYALKVANENPGSVKLAMLNVAATGLTLNPAHKLAYLVPRQGAIVLDIGYRGITKIATDAGAIMWARADIVREKDRFTYRGPAKEPTFETDAIFGDRGEVVGAFCVAKTREGDVMCGVMSLAELHKVRDASELYAQFKKGPWVDYFGQMCKKAVIKRDANTWPQTGESGKLFEAIALANAAEGGYTFDGEAERIPKELISDDRKQRHDEAVEQYGDAIAKIKDRIAAWSQDQDPDHLYTVAEIWYELPQRAQMDLWLAPKFGGVFTTHERNILHDHVPGSTANQLPARPDDMAQAPAQPLPPARRTRAEEHKKRCDDAAEQYGVALAQIKDRLAAYQSDLDARHLFTIASLWRDIPSQARIDLCLAPSKGGVFTTRERQIMSELPHGGVATS